MWGQLLNITRNLVRQVHRQTGPLNVAVLHMSLCRQDAIACSCMIASFRSSASGMPSHNILDVGAGFWHALSKFGSTV